METLIIQIKFNSLDQQNIYIHQCFYFVPFSYIYSQTWLILTTIISHFYWAGHYLLDTHHWQAMLNAALHH